MGTSYQRSRIQLTATPLNSDLVVEFERLGHATIERVFSDAEIDTLTAAIEQACHDGAARRRRNDAYAMRDVHRAVPHLIDSGAVARLREIASALLGAPAFVTRSLLFDKPAGANWSIRWHQDVTIAVRERRDVPGFGPWSVKAGIPHVRATGDVLSGMVALRVHLDDCGEDNGALLVASGAHRQGRLDAEAVTATRSRCAISTLTCQRGAVIAMRPLLPHASRPASSPAHRRVVHLEFACDELPGDLDWFDRA